MTSRLFEEWFHKSFVPKVKIFQEKNNLPQKAILLVDNAPSHLKEELVSNCKNYKTMFLPPNTTSIVQPMDQNPIRLTKMYYKKSLLCEIIRSDETDYGKFLKSFTIQKCCILLKNAWAKLSDTAIKSSWNKLFPNRWNSEDDLPLSILQERLSFNEDSEEGTLMFISDTLRNEFDINFTSEDAEGWINNTASLLLDDLSSTDISEEEDEEENVPITHHIKAKDALPSIEASIKFAEQIGFDIEKLSALYELRSLALEKSLSKSRQAKVSDFFAKKN